MNRNSKRAVAAFAALQILLYHCWLPVFPYGTVPGAVERFLVAATYSGVDVFFFISAYSLVQRPVENYRSFIRNRAVKLLPLFIIALIFKKFLWFIPSIMIMYLVLPLLYKVCRKRPILSFVLLLAGWAGVVFLCLGVLKPEQDIGIFLFRIPSIILGAYAARIVERWKEKDSTKVEGLPDTIGQTNGPTGANMQAKCLVQKCCENWKMRAVIGIVLTVAGLLLIYNFGYMHRLNTPYRGTFYLTGIPAMLGEIIILSLLFSKREFRIISFFGSMTLELYFVQMMFGTLLVNLIYGFTGSKLITNIAVMAIITAAAAIIRMINNMITKLLAAE